jgi:predicted AlkP superfamily phosphohydrolase/phosphomutase
VLNEETQRRLASIAFRDGYRWERTGVFPAPSWSTGLVRANVLGREAQGTVRPHKVDDVLGEAERLVRGLVDADTGEPLVRDVARTADVFPGAKTAELPDLLVRWAGSRPARAARHPELGEWTAPLPAPHVWSEHRGSALAFVAGPDLPGAEGEVDRDQLGLAPTLLALAGADGSALPGAAWF